MRFQIFTYLFSEGRARVDTQKKSLQKVKSSLRCKTLRTSFSLCRILFVLITE